MGKPQVEKLFSSVRQATGWQQLELVELLLRPPIDEEVRFFLLREGLLEPGLAGYVALPIAQRCDLAGALQGSQVDGPTLAAAGRILWQLAEDALRGGPNGDLRDYADGAEAALRYLAMMMESASSLADFLAINALRTFVRSIAEREPLTGWTSEAEQRVLTDADGILARPAWRELAVSALADPEHPSWREAFIVAQCLSLSLGQRLPERLKKDPYDSRLWEAAIAVSIPSSADELVHLAVSLLDLQRICVGPQLQVGFGPDLVAQLTLEGVLRGIRRLPGSGAEAIHLGLNAPRAGTRLVALDVLFDWPESALPEAVQRAVVACLDDPSPQVRLRAAELLRGWSSAL